MRTALIGYGNVAKAFARLLFDQRSVYPFRIVGIHTRRGTAYDSRGLALEPTFGEPAISLNEFLDRASPEVVIEITTLNPESGEPAISHIRSAFARGIHVITANKGPIAHAYSSLCDEAKRAQVEFRFESTVMDGAPVFNQFRNNLPGVKVLGFTGVLNSTSKVAVAAMQRGLTMQDGIREAQSMGIAEVDAFYDIDGWDSAAKTAAIANVLMDARTTPPRVVRSGLRDLTTEQAVEYARTGQSVLLVSRAKRSEDGSLQLSVQPEVIPETDLLATARGSSNLLLFHTDLMGTIGTVSVNPGVEQTAYGLFSDLVDIARSI
ncbi:MAG: homoserine dehydrogenase [Acidobacteriota bacterium]|nr:homoserine dehydrogenase [Acidobacteriota bacterium]